MINNGAKFLSLVLSVLVLVLPFSDISFAGTIAKQQIEQAQPCHQHNGVAPEDHCPESGTAQCQCCDFTSTAVISYKTPASHLALLVSSIVQDNYLESYISQSTTPPFRPPRFFA